MVMGTCLGDHVHRHLVAGDEDARGPERQDDRHLPDRQGRLRERRSSATSCSWWCRRRRCSSSCSPPTRASPTSPGWPASTPTTHFMPKQLTKRGHRLVFSNGIIALAIAGAVLVVVFQADVTHLIPLYAIGVFTSFTLSQTGMAIRHLRLKEVGWRLGLAINGTGAVATGVVTIVIADHQVHPRRLVHHDPRPGDGGRPREAQPPVRVREGGPRRRPRGRHQHPVLRRHSVLLHGRRDRPQHGRAPSSTPARCTPDEMRAVHIATDPLGPQDLVDEWADAAACNECPLEVVDCPDRRIARGRRAAGGRGARDGTRPRSPCSCRGASTRALAPAPARPHRRCDRQGRRRRSRTPT